MFQYLAGPRKMLLTVGFAAAVFLIPAEAYGGELVHISAIDRSGSTRTTDPDGYSTSAALLRAELLVPARYLLYTFAGLAGSAAGGVQALGPYDLAVSDHLAALRHQTEQLHRQAGGRAGDTPLAAVVQEAYATLERMDAQPGSDLTIFSDGEPAPDPAAQYAAIRKLLPAWKSRGWRISAVSLGPVNSGWSAALAALAAETGGLSGHVSRPEELNRLFIEQWAQLSGLPSPQSMADQIPGSGAVQHRWSFDGTVRKVTLVITRPGTETGVRLYAPGGGQLDRTDPRVVTWSDSDPHFVLIRLQSDQPLGEGAWQMVIAGRPGATVLSSAVFSSQVSVRMESPRSGELVAAGQPVLFTAQMLDGDRPLLSAAARVRLEIRDQAENLTVADLLDDGLAEQSGDQYRGDGKYTARISLKQAGSYRYRLSALYDGKGWLTQEGAFGADYFPALQPLPLPQQVAVSPGKSVSLDLARLVVGEGTADPTSLSEVTVTVRSVRGDLVAQQKLDPREAFADGRLRISLTPRRQDGAFRANDRGGLSEAVYEVQVGLAGTHRGQAFRQPNALSVPVRTAIALPETPLHWAQRLLGVMRAHPVATGWASAALTVLLGLLWATWRLRTAPRLGGVLRARPSGRNRGVAAIDLATAMGVLPWFRRLGTPWVAGSVVDGRLAGLDVGAAPGRVLVRAAGTTEGRLNGDQLTGRWQELSTGSVLRIAAVEFLFEGLEGPDAAASTIGIRRSPTEGVRGAGRSSQW